MDLSQLDTVKAADVGSSLPLRHPVTDAPLTDEATKEPITISLMGADSTEYKKAVHESTNRRLAKTVKRGRVNMSAEDFDADSINTLVRCTKGWKHIVVAGKELEFSPENARVLYTDFPWIREQVDGYIADRANFLGNLPRT